VRSNEQPYSDFWPLTHNPAPFTGQDHVRGPQQQPDAQADPGGQGQDAQQAHPQGRLCRAAF